MIKPWIFTGLPCFVISGPNVGASVTGCFVGFTVVGIDVVGACVTVGEDVKGAQKNVLFSSHFC